MIDCCNAQLQIPKRDILLSFEHKGDRSYCVHKKWDMLCFMKLRPEIFYVNPYMSIGVSHFNLLDELIA